MFFECTLYVNLVIKKLMVLQYHCNYNKINVSESFLDIKLLYVLIKKIINNYWCKIQPHKCVIINKIFYFDYCLFRYTI